MKEGDTLVNASIGAVITFVTASYLPLAPVFAGSVAGYLEGGDRMDGVRVGAYAGLIALVPTVLFVSFAVSVLGLGIGIGLLTGVVGSLAGILGVVILLFFLVATSIYFVGGGAVGGWLGNYVKYDTDVDL